MSDDDPMLVHALGYAVDQALPVFPVSAAKIPFKGSAGHKDATTDSDRIRAMWHDHPGAMIAAATGDRCGYCVLDVDTKEAHGADGRVTAKKLGLSFAGGVVALTPSGGWHVWYRTGGQALPSKNGLIGPGLDFKADGGYVVLPPSRPDPKKGGYQWVNGSDLSTAVEVPAAIVAALKRTPHERDFLEACEPIRNAAVGTRRTLLNAAAFKFAFQVIAERLSEKLYRDALTNAALCCGLDRITADKTVADALKDARAKAPDRSSRKPGKAEAPAAVGDTEPWDEEVDGGLALNDAISVLRRHVILTSAQCMVVVVWALHTHLIDAGFHSPRLNLYSPAKRCGKSTLRRIVAGFVARPVLGENLSPAVIYHVADAHRPTFLFDEIHLLLSHRNHDRPTLYSLMSAGYERTGTTWRMQGEGSAMTAKAFRTYSPMLLAGIGRMGGSLGDRCIPIQLKRKLKGEAVELFDFEADQSGLVDVGRKFARWAIDNADAVRAAKLDRASFPGGWDDRQCDCARPLLKIATVLGGAWLEAVRNALGEVWRAATDADIEEDDNLSAALLADIEATFTDLYPDPQQRQEMLDLKSKAHVSSARMVELLTDDPLKPWSAMGHRQKPLTQNGLARMLRPYGVSPHMVEPKTRTRGYFWRQFADAWRRYA